MPMHLDRGAALATALVALLAVTGAASPALADEAQDCARLNGLEIPARNISLPTRGGKLTSAELVRRDDGAVFCRTRGQLEPIDAKAWPVLFQVNLPVKWNGKAIHVGGGGSNGVLITGEAAARTAPPSAPAPLLQGYVTFGTDGGHPLTPPDTHAFALNDEATVNQAYAAYKKTYDAALQVMQAHYAERPKRLYFMGYSEGGREALMMIQRYPADYDGVTVQVPAMHWSGQHLAHYEQWTRQQDGGWLNPAKIKTLETAVRSACDDLDGLKDAVVSRYMGCGKIFDIAKLRCPGGRDAGDGCLSDKQLYFARSIYEPYRFAFPLADGQTEYPGSPYGAEAQQGGVAGGLMTRDQRQPGDLGRPLAGPGSVRFFFARDAAFTGPFDMNKYRERLEKLSALFDPTDPDLSAFAARGGKVLMIENMADYLRSPYAAAAYYDSVVARMGRDRVDGFFRFYIAAGLNHGGSGVTADGKALPTHVDLLTTLDQWRDGAAPGALTMTDASGSTSRPLCAWGTYAHYQGGDPNIAASYACRSVR